jgi:hypothetical protein
MLRWVVFIHVSGLRCHCFDRRISPGFIAQLGIPAQCKTNDGAWSMVYTSRLVVWHQDTACTGPENDKLGLKMIIRSNGGVIGLWGWSSCHLERSHCRKTYRFLKDPQLSSCKSSVFTMFYKRLRPLNWTIAASQIPSRQESSLRMDWCNTMK